MYNVKTYEIMSFQAIDYRTGEAHILYQLLQDGLRNMWIDPLQRLQDSAERIIVTGEGKRQITICTDRPHDSREIFTILEKLGIAWHIRACTNSTRRTKAQDREYINSVLKQPGGEGVTPANCQNE